MLSEAPSSFSAYGQQPSSYGTFRTATLSVHVSAWAWKQSVGDAGAKLVLLKLADQANDAGESFPGLARLAEECEMSKSTMQRKLKLLEAAGLIAVEKRTRKGSNAQTSNLYRIDPSASRRVVNLTTPPGQPDHPGVSPVTTLEPSLEPTASNEAGGEPAEPTKINPVTPFFDAWVAIVQREPLTPSERGKWARGFRELVSADVTTEQLSALCKEYRRKWPDAELTPTGLAANLSAIAHRAKPARESHAERVRRIMEERGIA